MKRRQLMIAAAASLGMSERAAKASSKPEELLWRSRFERPSGGTLEMTALRGKPLLLNFWGTWCPPCVKEMPELDRFYREHLARGWQVLGLAVDNPRVVREFMTRKPVSYLIAMAGTEGTELARQLGNTGGGLPYTVMLDSRGVIVRRKSGQTDYAELAAWALSI